MRIHAQGTHVARSHGTLEPLLVSTKIRQPPILRIPWWGVKHVGRALQFHGDQINDKNDKKDKTHHFYLFYRLYRFYRLFKR